MNEKQRQIIKQAQEHRHLIFKIKTGKEVRDTIIQVGQAKFSTIASKARQARRKGKSVDIMYLFTCSRLELRKGNWID